MKVYLEYDPKVFQKAREEGLLDEREKDKKKKYQDFIINPTMSTIRNFEKLYYNSEPRAIIWDNGNSIDLYVSTNKRDVHTNLLQNIGHTFDDSFLIKEANVYEDGSWWKDIKPSEFFICIHFYRGRWLLSESYHYKFLEDEFFTDNIEHFEHQIAKKIKGFKIYIDRYEGPR